MADEGEMLLHASINDATYLYDTMRLQTTTYPLYLFTDIHHVPSYPSHETAIKTSLLFRLFC
jgi:hypothetical protein